MGRNLVFDATKVPNWTQTIKDILGNGNLNSNNGFSYCRDRIYELFNDLRDPETWRGPAAVANLKDFKDVLNSLISFTNKMNVTFDGITHAFGCKVKEVMGNLTQTYSDDVITQQLESFDESNIDSTVVSYNYNKMRDIYNQLLVIKNKLKLAEGDLLEEINKLDSGCGIWNGNVAYAAKIKLSKEAQTSYDDLINKVDKVISNVGDVITNATMVDK